MQPLNLNLHLDKKRLSYGLAAVALILCAAVGAVLWRNHNAPKVVQEDVPLVRTMVVGLTDAAQNYTYAGEVRGRYEKPLSFQVSGKIIKRHVELGSVVQPGDALMEIDPKDIQQSVNSSLAQVSAAQAQLDLASKNLARYRQLYEQNAISKAQYDQFVSAYDSAVAALRQASAQYAESANQLEYTTLRADSAGVISSVDAEVGQVVAAGQRVLTLVQEGEREVEINVPENRIDALRKAKQIKVSFWALPNVSVDGQVREIAPMADKVMRTYKVRISLLNPVPEIKLGMTATVTVGGVESQQAVAFVPLSAIYQTGDTPAVWVVEDGAVKLRPVRIGAFGDNQVQVLAGLQNGDVVVTAGVHKLREGQRVRIAGDSL